MESLDHRRMLADRAREVTEIGGVTGVGDPEEHLSGRWFQNRRVGLRCKAGNEKKRPEERSTKQSDLGLAGVDHG